MYSKRLKFNLLNASLITYKPKTVQQIFVKTFEIEVEVM